MPNIEVWDLLCETCAVMCNTDGFVLPVRHKMKQLHDFNALCLNFGRTKSDPAANRSPAFWKAMSNHVKMWQEAVMETGSFRVGRPGCMHVSQENTGLFIHLHHTPLQYLERM